jgi:hypothetical protein
MSAHPSKMGHSVGWCSQSEGSTRIPRNGREKGTTCGPAKNTVRPTSVISGKMWRSVNTPLVLKGLKRAALAAEADKQKQGTCSAE